jgi:hypothetical protein
MLSSQKMMSAPSGGGADNNFKNVTLLLNGDGTNGAQNNTFVDSSTNNFTITRNGNTTQGSFSPYGSNWSSYLDGSSYIYTSASSNAFNFGTGDFTVEFWLYPTDTSRVSTIAAATYYTGFYIQKDLASGLIFDFNDGALNLQGSNFDNTKNTWTHYALVRSGGTASLFQNGTRVATTSNSADISISGTIIIGASDTSGSYAAKTGYISNFRVVKGTAVYSPSASTITVPTTPLTAVTNTSLLVLGSNRFVDLSTNNAALTLSGSPKIQRFSPFSPTASYSTATIGGSGYFDGGGDYLQTASSSSVSVFAGDFTIEGWFYITGSATWNDIVGASSNDWYIEVNNDQYIDTSLGITSSSGSASKNAWNHFAVVRSGSTIALMLNGTRVGTTTNSSTIGTTSAVLIGSNGEPATGYISNIRIVNGTAVYSPSESTYTVPTSPLTAVSNTQLLCNMTNAGIPDSAMMNNLETRGNAQVSTSVKKYGTGSIAFDGTGDYLYSANVQDFAYGTGDFTVEMWFYPTQSAIGIDTEEYLYDTRPSGTNGAYSSLYIKKTNDNIAWLQGGTDRILSGTFSFNTWHHLAVCRSGTSTKMFLDGTQVGSTYTDTTNYGAGRLTIGSSSYSFNSLLYYGNIDDLRITKGYARYTSNFTPPTEALPTK